MGLSSLFHQLALKSLFLKVKNSIRLLIKLGHFMPSFSTILLKRLIAFSRFSESSTTIVAIRIHPLSNGVP